MKGMVFPDTDCISCIYTECSKIAVELIHYVDLIVTLFSYIRHVFLIEV